MLVTPTVGYAVHGDTLDAVLGLEAYVLPGGRASFSSEQDELVARMRRMGAGWDAVARALGRSKPDTRDRYDPDYVRPYERARPIVPVVPKAAEPPKRLSRGNQRRFDLPRDVLPDTMEARCLALIGEGVVWRLEMAARLARSPKHVSVLVSVLVAKGLAVRLAGDPPLALTPAGVVQLQKLAQAAALRG